MAQQTKSLEELIRELPEDLRQETADFVQFLIQKRGHTPIEGKNHNTFKFDWEGGLSEFKDQYTSVELQHKLLDEWDTDVPS